MRIISNEVTALVVDDSSHSMEKTKAGFSLGSYLQCLLLDLRNARQGIGAFLSPRGNPTTRVIAIFSSNTQKFQGPDGTADISNFA